MRRIALIGPVYPFRAGIAHCTTRLAAELGKRFEVTLISFKRQYPKLLYPGGDDIDDTLRGKTPASANFLLDILSPLSWVRVGRMLRRERIDAVVFVWWIWVWAIPYLVIQAVAGSKTILQCHNVADKEPAWWKTALTNVVLRRADWVLVHAASEEKELRRRIGEGARVSRTFLPVHDMGELMPARGIARSWMELTAPRIALFFGHVRPFKGLDIALQAWKKLKSEVLLLIAGEIWGDAELYRKLVDELDLRDRVRFESRFIPDSEIADYFAAADVVIAPYRHEAQSGVVLTAFHFGRPVIATAVGGIPEIVEDGVNGFLVPAEDPLALALAVDRFFAGADAAAMEAAAKRTGGKYSWEEYGMRFGDLIGHIIGT